MGAALSGCSSASPAGDTSSQSVIAPDRFNFAVHAERGQHLSVDNAYWLGLLSGASYADAGSGPDKLPQAFASRGIDVTKPGFEFTFFDEFLTDTQAFYLATPEVAFLAFRGTTSVRDFATDFDGADAKKPNPRADFAPGSRVHRGYANAIDATWGFKNLSDFLRARHTGAHSSKPLYITGHSMGGALALLAAYRALFDGCLKNSAWRTKAAIDPKAACLSDYIPVEAVYTFGQPLVGDASFVGLLSARLATTGTSYFRFANADDGVPAFPKDLGFAHIDADAGQPTLVGLTRAGHLKVGTNPNGIDDRVPGAPAEDCGDRSGNDHKIQAYVSKILANANGVEWKPTEKCE